MTTALLVNSGEFFAQDAIDNLDTKALYSDEQITDVFGHICEYFDRHHEYLNDETTADQVGFFLFNRSLHLLGYTHSHNEPLPDEQGRIEYTLFDSPDAFSSQLAMRGTMSFFNAAVGVAKVVHWASELEMSANDAEENSEPEPLAFELDEMMRQSGLQWAILSNGRKWRLFHKNTVAMASTFVEMNLVEMIQNKDRDAFAVFMTIFGARALAPDNTGTCPNRLHLS